MLKSLSKYVNHINSEVVADMALHSDSADDLDTMDCFLDFHEINDLPKKIHSPVVDLRVDEHLAHWHHKK